MDKNKTLDLNDKAKEINEFLRNVLGLIEHKRLYVLGSILYALEDSTFRSIYPSINTTQDLALYLFQTVEMRIKESKCSMFDAIINELKPVLLELNEKEGARKDCPDGALLKLVSMVDGSFGLHENGDLVNDLFNVFLSYSTSGGSDLGIVLTPAHVTMLFCELAAVNLKSKILDICAGTGGFLTSALKRIGVNIVFTTEQQQTFVEHNLFGIEKEPSIFTVLTLNMIINKEGRTNLVLGDAFGQDLKEKIKKMDCNVGFLNPPFSDKIHSELSFVELLLDSLLPDSIGIVVVPVNAVSSRTKKHDNTEIKKRLLDKHALIASIQMPNNLFYPKGVETVVLVFKTCIPNDGTTTWFARYDDGFEIIKHQKTRTPTERSDDLYTRLVDAYNKKEETGFSFKKAMTHEDQWVYAIHSDVNYKITTQDLQSTLNEFVAYLYTNNYL